mmetsp:Transcript_7064/g.17522  ORF Transcript_7064/g.17522 Transcript_7064/m.17522 type:complete len:208 (-) Transcript_7064:1041-1664(-)
MQITPDEYRINSAIVSGVHLSAAMMKSPSFSRLSSSTTTINSPLATAAMASSTDFRPKQYPFSAACTPDWLGSSMRAAATSAAACSVTELPSFIKISTCEYSGEITDSGDAESIDPKFEWFILSTFVSKYFRLNGVAFGTTMGIVPATSTPNAVSLSIFRGLFVMRRIESMPRSFNMDGTTPYWRKSSGKPRCVLASTVSSPMSCRA